VDETPRLEFESRRFGGGLERETSLGNTAHASVGDVVRGRGGTCRLRPRTVVRPAWSWSLDGDFGPNRRSTGWSMCRTTDSQEAVSESGDRLVRRMTHVSLPVPGDSQGSCGQVRRTGCRGLTAAVILWSGVQGHGRQTFDACVGRRSGKRKTSRLASPQNDATAKGMGSTNTALRLSDVFEVPGEPHERSLPAQ